MSGATRALLAALLGVGVTAIPCAAGDVQAAAVDEPTAARRERDEPGEASPEGDAPAGTRPDAGDSTATAAGEVESAADGPERDPLAPVNRRIFWLNDKLDVYVLEPVARGWDKIAPDPVQTSVNNFFLNLRFPIVALNDLLQGKVQACATDVARFVTNTTFGVAGFFDPATGWGLERHSEDFGQTLGWWGVPAGPYLVLPLLGPSSVRDTGGLVVDYFASVLPFVVDRWLLVGAGAVNTVNFRSLVLEEVRDAKQTSFDYYAFVRNAYVQRRAALIQDTTTTTGPGDDLYELEDDHAN